MVLCFANFSGNDSVIAALRETATPEPTELPPATPSPSPTATPSPTPTSTPEVTATPKPTMVASYEILDGIPQTDQPLGLVECDPVDDSYFNKTVFIGDSVTLKLQHYVTEMRKKKYPNLLGKAHFLALGSFSTHDNLSKVTKESLHPMVKGKKMIVEDALQKAGSEKVYIMLGMNDVASKGLEKSVTNMGTMLQRILEKCPDIEIFVESVTPRVKGSYPSTTELFKYNIRVYEEILKLDNPQIHFVDVAYVMRDKRGKLFESYCSDINTMAMHFTDKGCEAWIKYLYTHAYV